MAGGGIWFPKWQTGAPGCAKVPTAPKKKARRFYLPGWVLSYRKQASP